MTTRMFPMLCLLLLAHGVTAAPITFDLYQGGYAAGGFLSGTLTGEDLDNDGWLTSSEVTHYSLAFTNDIEQASPGSYAIPFIVENPASGSDTPSLSINYELNGVGILGDSTLEYIVAGRSRPGGGYNQYDSGYPGLPNAPGGRVWDNSGHSIANHPGLFTSSLLMMTPASGVPVPSSFLLLLAGLLLIVRRR